MFAKQSEAKILSWIENSELEMFGRYLVSGTIHGKPGVPVAELTRLENIFKRTLTEEERYLLGKRLLRRSEYTARNLGSHLVVSGWPQHKNVAALVKLAAENDDWIVREYAAGAFAELLEKDFKHFSELFLVWVESSSVSVKRAVALAVKYGSKSGDPKKIKTYLKLIEPLLAEEAEYIRKNLGPFAIGDGLLSRYPEQILNRGQAWSKSKDQNVRWNTAMIFTAAAARSFASKALPILKQLEKDPTPAVCRAAKKALKNISR